MLSVEAMVADDEVWGNYTTHHRVRKPNIHTGYLHQIKGSSYKLLVT